MWSLDFAYSGKACPGTTSIMTMASTARIPNIMSLNISFPSLFDYIEDAGSLSPQPQFVAASLPFASVSLVIAKTVPDIRED
jgi:hypothetical protein